MAGVEARRGTGRALGEVRGLDSGLYNCISFDGGGTTGWALMSLRVEYFYYRRARLLDHVAFWAAGQYVGPRVMQVAEAIELISAWAPQYPDARNGDMAPLDNLAVVAESFTLRQFRRDPTLLEPVRFNAGLDQELWRLRPKRLLTEQGPAMALGEVPDTRLAAAEAYAAEEGLPGGYFISTRGKPHARDALRHCFTFLQREKEARWDGRSLVRVGGTSKGALGERLG